MEYGDEDARAFWSSVIVITVIPTFRPDVSPPAPLMGAFCSSLQVTLLAEVGATLVPQRPIAEMSAYQSVLLQNEVLCRALR
jgi:hypothetical protein